MYQSCCETHIFHFFFFSHCFIFLSHSSELRCYVQMDTLCITTHPSSRNFIRFELFEGEIISIDLLFKYTINQNSIGQLERPVDQ